jgi:hypothetical protein
MFPEHLYPNTMPDDHGAYDNCAEQDDVKLPAGDGSGCEAKDAEENVEMGACSVRGGGVEWWTCVYSYEGQEYSWVERDCCTDGDAPW